MADDALATADVWTVLDLIVAEWTSDPTSVQCFDSRLRERAAVLVDARRQARAAGGDLAFNELADALGAWLDTKGWTTLVVGNPEVRGYETSGFHQYEFAVKFTGGRRPQAPKLPGIILPGDGGTH